jgi:uncharacterized protein YoxC
MKGIKDQWIRGTQKIKQKMGKSDKTVDEEYEQIHSKTLSTEKQAQNFSKHVNQLIENYHAMSSTLSFLAEDIKDLYNNSSPNSKQRQMAEQLSKFVENVERECVSKFQNQIASNVVGPSDEYLVQFPPLKDLHKAREKAVLEYDYYRDKVQSLSEKQSKDPLALPRAKEKLKQVKDDFEMVNNNAKTEMSGVLDRKESVYDSAVEQLFGSIIQFYDKISKEAATLKSYSSEPRSGPSFSSSSSSQSGAAKTLYPSRPNTTSRVPPEFDYDFFYLDAELERHGPLSFSALKQKYQTGELNADSYVFGGQMKDWTQISAIPNLKSALSS